MNPPEMNPHEINPPEMNPPEINPPEMNPPEMNPPEISKENNKMILQIGTYTDIGTCSENQDLHLIYPLTDHNGYLIAVADGHGKEGKTVVTITMNTLKTLVQEKIVELAENPQTFLENAFEYIHNEIRIELCDFLKNDGFEVVVDDQGDILKRRHSYEMFTSVKSGTTLSVVIFIYNKLYVANVGDSTALLCSKTGYTELTSNHSPDNPQEYIRMREFKCYESDPKQAELLCVYDIQGRYKPSCPHIFNISEEGVPTVRPDDDSFTYYINTVRRDKAVYLSDRQGENILAFTRALGDFKMASLGVSCKPDIRCIDIDNETCCVVLGSDGVWDNWQYDHIRKFVMDESCLKALEDENGANCVAKSLILRNANFARRNFRNDIDNSIVVIMYFIK